jgi:hypothetical protein
MSLLKSACHVWLLIRSPDPGAGPLASSNPHRPPSSPYWLAGLTTPTLSPYGSCHDCQTCRPLTVFGERSTACRCAKTGSITDYRPLSTVQDSPSP